MEDFERKLKRAGFRCRRDRRRADAPPVDPQKKERSASVVRKKLKVLGIDQGICLGCGSNDVSTFQFDHIAGRKHHHRLWPLCFDCHQEKTFMGYLDPPPSANPKNVFDVIGHWLLNMANYLDIAIRFLQIVISQLRAYGAYLVGLANQGYGDELAVPI
jgi:hypothetical protein